MKTLDSGFRRNDVKQHQTNFFTASGGLRGIICIWKLCAVKSKFQAPAFVPQGGASRRQAKFQTSYNVPNQKTPN